ncbi:MAG TPA: hypothetical protein VEW48_20765 [Thermoanaerobaculia bacterium]|nr:hypothetical protein [Thermoanaerobaculia bacterium]
MPRFHLEQFRRPVAGAIFLLLVLGLATAVAAQNLPLPLKLTAFAVNLGADRPAARANMVEINVDRWSTEAERNALMDTFRRNGSDALLAALQKTPRVGYIRTPDSIGWDLHYAHAEPLPDGGYRIIIGTDRRISFWERYNNARSVDYPFTLIELRLDPKGNGEGRMSLATRVTTSGDGKHLELENYSAQPVLLNNVKIQGK